MKAANDTSQRAQQEQRVRDLEGELSRSHSVQQDSLLQRDSSRTELERYKHLYSEELRLRKSLAAKLERWERDGASPQSYIYKYVFIITTAQSHFQIQTLKLVALATKKVWWRLLQCLSDAENYIYLPSKTKNNQLKKLQL